MVLFLNDHIALSVVPYTTSIPRFVCNIQVPFVRGVTVKSGTGGEREVKKEEDIIGNKAFYLYILI
jgi:hypothetical protein